MIPNNDKSEHERYLCEELYQDPVFVRAYPQAIKAFYMKANPIDINHPEQKTVAGLDLLVPGIGELIGGSLREDNYQQLMTNKEQFKIDSKVCNDTLICVSLVMHQVQGLV